jgi:uncharacterized membrane protein YagU involved in acid resistance
MDYIARLYLNVAKQKQNKSTEGCTWEKLTETLLRLPWSLFIYHLSLSFVFLPKYITCSTFKLESRYFKQSLLAMHTVTECAMKSIPCCVFRTKAAAQSWDTYTMGQHCYKHFRFLTHLTFNMVLVLIYLEIFYSYQSLVTHIQLGNTTWGYDPQLKKLGFKVSLQTNNNIQDAPPPCMYLPSLHVLRKVKSSNSLQNALHIWILDP